MSSNFDRFQLPDERDDYYTCIMCDKRTHYEDLATNRKEHICKACAEDYVDVDL